MSIIKDFKWEIISEKLIHKDDQAILDRVYSSLNEPYKLRTDLFPEPYVGNPKTATVILLALNPGYEGGERKWYANYNGRVETILKNNLNHENTQNPYYYFDESLSKDSPGHDYIKKRFKAVIDKGITIDMLANKMAMIQFFPYHSNKFKYSKQYLPSQEYNFSLVLEAMANKKLIVCLRSFKKWEDGLTYYLQKYPELKGNEKLQFHFNEKKGEVF